MSRRIATGFVLLFSALMLSPARAASTVTVDFDFSLTLSQVLLPDLSPADPGDYVSIEEVNTAQNHLEFFSGIANGSGGVVNTFNNNPVNDTQELLLGDTVRSVLTTTSTTSGLGGVGQRNQYGDVFFGIASESFEALTFIFDWEASWNIETTNMSAGDQAVGRADVVINIFTDNGLTTIDLFPQSTPQEIIGLNFLASTTTEIGATSGTIQFVLTDTNPEASINYNVFGSSNPRINAIPVPAAAWLLGSSVFVFLGMRRRNPG